MRSSRLEKTNQNVRINPSKREIERVRERSREGRGEGGRVVRGATKRTVAAGGQIKRGIK